VHDSGNVTFFALTLVFFYSTESVRGKRGFELHGAVKPLAFFCRHLALLALCHLCVRQTTRQSDIYFTHTAWYPSGLHFRFELKKPE
jgi:hypothetical protein